MALVNASIKNRIMSVPDDVELVCNNPTDVIEIDFDEEWNGRTGYVARFEWNGKYFDVPFEGTQVKVPEISNTGWIMFGVYADNLASAPAKVKCKKSILCYGNGERQVPANPFYDEFVERLEDVEEAIAQGGGGSGGITEETDPTVPAWAKQPEKPKYTAEEVGAQPKGDYASHDEVERLSEEIVDELYTKNINLFDVSQQTLETISPHYWVNGAPYATTQFDSTYHCTAPVPVEENTQYAIGCVPGVSWGSINNMVKPWNKASSGVFFYGDNNAYIGGTGDGVFTTPAGTRYIRFNFQLVWMDVPNNIERVLGSCVLVKGDVLPLTYVPYGKTSIKENIESLENAKAAFPIRYVANSKTGDITVASRYNTEKDLMVRLMKKGGNNIFDFYLFALINVGSSIHTNLDATNFTVELLRTRTDWHAPFQVKALENADGDLQDVTHFTGGNHDYTNGGSGGTPTGRTASVRFFADGREVFVEDGFCNLLEIVWTNFVQATNTKKEDGTGREVLVERHRMTFDGCEWKTQVEIEPLEGIEMVLYYGLQISGGGTLYNRARYYGGVNRLEYDTTAEGTSCGNKNATAIRWHGDEHEVIMSIDPTFDAGSREFYSGTSGLFTATYGKAYANFFTNKQMQAGEIYSLRGSYVFRPYLGD